jgi:hypothetical protein
MAAKLGSDDVSFRLGSGEVAAVYLGSEQVWSAVSVPGKPTIIEAYPDNGLTVVIITPPADGGSAITGYVAYIDGLSMDFTSVVDPVDGNVTIFLTGEYEFQEAEVAAVNAIGEGPKSDPATVTAL